MTGGIRRTTLDDFAASPRTDGRVIYAVGDVHGRYDLLTVLLEAVVADAAALPADAAPLLVLCGDYVDRGPASREVMAALVWLWRHAPLEVRFLRGNHEAALLDFVDRPDTLPALLEIGGDATLRSYGIDVPRVAHDGPDALAGLRDTLLDRMPASHLAILRAMPASTTCGDVVFVHAGLRPGVALNRQDDRDLMSIGAPFRAATTRFEKMVVHGHGGVDGEVEVTPHRIGIDTGAWQTGVLTALRLDGATATLLQTCGGATVGSSPGIAVDGDGDAGDDDGAISLRGALSRLRPGY